MEASNKGAEALELLHNIDRKLSFLERVRKRILKAQTVSYKGKEGWRERRLERA